MDDHTAYVELLAELEGMGKAPTDGDAVLVHEPKRYLTTVFEWDRHGITMLCSRPCAHNAIRVAAEDVLREWCKVRKRGLIIEELDDIVRIGFTNGFDDELLGTGPTLAVALINAVRRVRGMKEKT